MSFTFSYRWVNPSTIFARATDSPPIQACDRDVLSHGAHGSRERMSPVSRSDLRFANTAGHPCEIPSSSSWLGRFSWVTVRRTMSWYGSTRNVTTDGPPGG